MPLDESVSVWIADLKEGDSAATQKLWERYFQRLVGLARRIFDPRLDRRPTRRTWP